jgi:4-hydroxy-3-methylbut-2-enyl diphosphate reductase IspH
MLLSLSDEECYRLTAAWEEEEKRQQQQEKEQLHGKQQHGEALATIQEVCQELLSPAVESITPLEVLYLPIPPPSLPLSPVSQ